ncbi:BEM_collapsed_G0028250.mRNA.1.CDS.1 [Saccharomyces cerevisiae]|nr:Snl1p [Saccharomyces cerevisiae YJM1355]CAI4407728.1 CQI_4a_G0026890.mRNA.1.CDS.1 [Saccharomyces cerevisiae]CAI4953892.1 ANL_HP_G0020840.mRNA.1.CDS.1 [Saccharomyces cerevisiae]CAI4961011.1 ANL_HP_G0026010.mRNA.1.CDS.1 [Saccharomyces cerevisiae]CAI5005525.1 ANL_HP_G0058880.mRNA.1.CDS.1 [Saccharomyces cerevisiae]
MSHSAMEHWKSKLSKTSTSTYVLLAVIAVVFLVTIRRPNGSKGKSSKKRASKKNKKGKNQFEKAPVPLTLEEQIDNVSLRYGNELEGRSKDLINRFDVEDEKDIYERNYCNEMLLKLLIELDSIDLINVDESLRRPLKEKRKGVIKEIQAMLKSLDSLK